MIGQYLSNTNKKSYSVDFAKYFRTKQGHYLALAGSNNNIPTHTDVEYATRSAASHGNSFSQLPCTRRRKLGWEGSIGPSGWSASGHQLRITRHTCMVTCALFASKDTQASPPPFYLRLPLENDRDLLAAFGWF